MGLLTLLLSLRVFGYGYSGDDTSAFRWDLLTDVAFFSEPMHTDGTMPTTSWLGSAGKNMVAQAHAHGVRCMLTVTLFNNSTSNFIHTFLSTPAAEAAGVLAIVDAVTANGADGVNIDFEFVASADKTLFTAFIQDLATQLHAANPRGEVSIAVPGSPYPGYDLTALGQAADMLMVMAYDYHYGGGPPGPVAPLADSTLWGAGSQKQAITLLKSKVADPRKIVLGTPLYGFDYYTTSTAVPGTKVSGTTAVAVTYKNTEIRAVTYGRIWDPASSTPYYQYVDAMGNHRQTFYDDEESVGLKLDQIVASGIGGVGLWELSYAAPSFWSVLQAKLPSDAPDAGPGGGAPEAGDGAGCGCSAGGPPRGAPTGLALLALLVAGRAMVRRQR